MALSSARYDPNDPRIYPYLSGQVFFPSSVNSLDHFFNDSGLFHEIRFSSHYETGTYLSVCLDPNTELTFEEIDSGEFLIRGEAGDQKHLDQICNCVCSIFSEQHFKCRFELYDIHDEEFAYYHYNWER